MAGWFLHWWKRFAAPAAPVETFGGEWTPATRAVEWQPCRRGPKTKAPFLETFPNAATSIAAAGTDSGHTSAFDPVSRRTYTFGFDNGSGVWLNIVQWRNIDTGEVGFVFPGLDTLVNTPGVVYHPVEKKFYLYGGRITTSTFTDIVQTFDPATEAFDTLGITLPAAMHAVAVCYDPESGDVFGFGGRLTATPTFTDMIWRHDISVGTIADTGANLPAAMMEIAAVYASETKRIYLAGGGNQTVSQTRIDVYDPASPGADPIASGIVLSEPKDSMAAAHVERSAKSFLYFFGGFNWATSAYSNRIEKLTVAGGDEAIATLSAALPKTDDDAIAAYDSVTGRIHTGPWLHSSGSQNEQQRKVVWLTFDPIGDNLGSEPALPSIPSGWSSVGNDATVYSKDPHGIAGNTLVIADFNNAAFVRAEKTLAAQTGIFLVEFECSIPFAGAGANYQFSLSDGSGNAIRLQTRSGTNWNIWDGSIYHPIAAIPAGSWHWVGVLVDQPNEQAWGFVDRTNKTGPHGGTTVGAPLNTIWFNSSTTGRESWLIRNLTIYDLIDGEWIPANRKTEWTPETRKL